MKKISAVVIALLLFLSLLSCATDEQEAPKKELKTLAEKFSYAQGMEAGEYLKGLHAEIDFDIVSQGMKDTFEETPLLSKQQASEVKKEFRKKMQEERARRVKELAEKNLKEGEAFLAENKKKKGVVTTASGLQYMVLREGDGPKPNATDRVKVHYRATAIDGTELASSYKLGEPMIVPVKDKPLMAAWTEGLQLMKVGSKYRLFVPPNLGFRKGMGFGGPKVTLIVELELLGIQK